MAVLHQINSMQARAARRCSKALPAWLAVGRGRSCSVLAVWAGGIGFTTMGTLRGV